jgi:hypothetical protein
MGLASNFFSDPAFAANATGAATEEETHPQRMDPDGSGQSLSSSAAPTHLTIRSFRCWIWQGFGSVSSPMRVDGSASSDSCAR